MIYNLNYTYYSTYLLLLIAVIDKSVIRLQQIIIVNFIEIS